MPEVRMPVSLYEVSARCIGEEVASLSGERRAGRRARSDGVYRCVRIVRPSCLETQTHVICPAAHLRRCFNLVFFQLRRPVLF